MTDRLSEIEARNKKEFDLNYHTLNGTARRILMDSIDATEIARALESDNARLNRELAEVKKNWDFSIALHNEAVSQRDAARAAKKVSDRAASAYCDSMVAARAEADALRAILSKVHALYLVKGMVAVGGDLPLLVEIKAALSPRRQDAERPFCDDPRGYTHPPTDQCEGHFPARPSGTAKAATQSQSGGGEPEPSGLRSPPAAASSEGPIPCCGANADDDSGPHDTYCKNYRAPKPEPRAFPPWPWCGCRYLYCPHSPIDSINELPPPDPASLD